MNICLPINDDQQLNSTLCAHFGSTPLFLIVNTDDMNCKVIPNKNTHHNHGGCQPLLSLEGESIDAMVVSGIGRGALNKLLAANITVYVSQHNNVQEVIDAYKSGTLSMMDATMTCAGHQQHHGESGCHH